jgi:hypothetical protein
VVKFQLALTMALKLRMLETPILLGQKTPKKNSLLMI